jgi:putative ABC transport system permease protein
MLPNRPAEIVGVVPDYAMGTSREPVRPMVFWIDPAFAYVLSVKVDGADVPGLLRALDDAWRGSGQVRPMRREFMDEAVERTYRDVIALRGVIAVCAGLALLVACIGLFALSAYTAERRTKEIGVRKAMGASTGDILRLLLWQFARPVLWANLIAWPSAYLVLSWWLRGFADRVTLDLWMFAAATAVAVAIAWTTVFLHALRVAGIKPVDALRYE